MPSLHFNSSRSADVSRTVALSRLPGVLFGRQATSLRPQGLRGGSTRVKQLYRPAHKIITQAKAWVSLVPFAGAALVAITRTMDYRRELRRLWESALDSYPFSRPLAGRARRLRAGYGGVVFLLQTVLPQSFVGGLAPALLPPHRTSGRSPRASRLAKVVQRRPADSRRCH